MSDIKQILGEYRTLHIVGLSSNESRDSHRVAQYLQTHGYRTIPINPREETVLGEVSYPSLAAAAAAAPVRLVDVFRRGDALPGIVGDILELGTVEIVWLQLDVHHEESEARLRDAGITVVADKCIKVEHSRLFF
ncbi:MAG: putative CoA-binding protein [Bradymonadia bacterium]|jgi:predicted CoA-binding protein